MGGSTFPLYKHIDKFIYYEFAQYSADTHQVYKPIATLIYSPVCCTLNEKTKNTVRHRTSEPHFCGCPPVILP